MKKAFLQAVMGVQQEGGVLLAFLLPPPSQHYLFAQKHLEHSWQAAENSRATQLMLALSHAPAYPLTHCTVAPRGERQLAASGAGRTPSPRDSLGSSILVCSLVVRRSKGCSCLPHRKGQCNQQAVGQRDLPP